MTKRWKILISAIVMGSSSQAFAQNNSAFGRDAFYWLSEINKASAVMVTESGIVSQDTGAVIAKALKDVAARVDADPKLRSSNYLVVEPLLIEAGGQEVSRLHSGRSRQDIAATSRRLSQRDAVLSLLEGLNVTRNALIQLAERHRDDIIPAYTWGVQAQPITVGHYISAYTEALEKHATRLQAVYANVNRSPLGSAAVGTSSFPIDRERLATLLGFDGPITNSLYANQISPIDTGVDLSSASIGIALTLGTFVSDMEAQYRFPTPWFTLAEGDLTGISSIMPQKRNPVALQQLRVDASAILGDGVGYYMKAHNVPAGMGDYKGAEPELTILRTKKLLEDVTNVVGQLQFNPERGLAEVNADYSASTELADILQRDANVPFRIGHHFASELVTFGRSKGLKPSEISFREAQRLFSEAARSEGYKPEQLPLTERRFRESMSAENLVLSSKGLGGPQPAEVVRMLSIQRQNLDADRGWVSNMKQRLADSAQALQATFDRLLR